MGIYGAVIGDICGSIYEWNNRKTEKPEEIRLTDIRCRFTDDTVLTAAIAEATRTGRDYKKALYKWANMYPDVGYGPQFKEWFRSEDPQPYNSWGNGSAMRVSPIGWYFDDEETVLGEAMASAEPTHNHPEGIKGAQAVALAVFLCRKGVEKQTLKDRIESEFGYDLSRTLAEIRPNYKFDVSCQGSVPEAIIAFLESTHFESSIKNAISIGGDSDTIACITGSIAEAYYQFNPHDVVYECAIDGIHGWLRKFARYKLTPEIRAALEMEPEFVPLLSTAPDAGLTDDNFIFCGP